VRRKVVSCAGSNIGKMHAKINKFYAKIRKYGN
jgi:hypothetical protein